MYICCLCVFVFLCVQIWCMMFVWQWCSSILNGHVQWDGWIILGGFAVSRVADKPELELNSNPPPYTHSPQMANWSAHRHRCNSVLRIQWYLNSSEIHSIQSGRLITNPTPNDGSLYTIQTVYNISTPPPTLQPPVHFAIKDNDPTKHRIHHHWFRICNWFTQWIIYDWGDQTPPNNNNGGH